MSSSIVDRLRSGPVPRRRGLRLRARAARLHQGGPVRPRGGARLARTRVRELHREFLRAGADVMVALTYYAHREKLRDVGREGDLEDDEPRRRCGSPARSRPRAARWWPATSATPGPTTRTTRRTGAGRSGHVRRAARLGGRGGRRLRHLRDQRLPRRGADRGCEVIRDLGLPAMVTLAPSVSRRPDPRRLRVRRRRAGSRPPRARRWSA
mgnify:CR=1 FL=1